MLAILKFVSIKRLKPIERYGSFGLQNLPRSKRGWRITSPNLEQSGLLKIDYVSLDELCASEEVWQGSHEILVAAAPETRARIARVLLVYMRRELAIKVDYLDQGAQEGIKQLSSQRLISPWAMDENETLEHSSILFPRRKLEIKLNMAATYICLPGVDTDNIYDVAILFPIFTIAFL